MVSRFYFGVLCLLSLGSNLVADDATFLGVERSRIERVIEMGYNMDLGTEAEIARVAAEFPDSPVSGVMEAGFLYWSQNYQQWDEELKEKFEERSAIALKQAERHLRKTPDDPDARFAVAMVELMQVIYYVDHHRWWSAFWKSRSSLKEMRRLVEEYPDYHDAKLPLGMHNCYMSRTPSYLKPLAFLMRFKGDWDLGLRYIMEARDNGLFCKVDSGYYLADIRLELEGDRQASRDEMARLVERYPGNLKFRAILAEHERGIGKQAVARELAKAILEDERIEDFQAIKGRAMITMLWSSLASQQFESAIETAEQLKSYASRFGEFEYERAWLDFVIAESYLGLGRREAALELWASISPESGKDAAIAARKRLEQESR